MSTVDRLAELKRQREATGPEAHAEARAQRRQRTEEMKIALRSRDLEQELAEIQEHEDLTRALQEDTRTTEAGSTPSTALAARLKSAETAEAEAVAFADQVRRDVFRLKHEILIDEQHRQLMTRHAERVRNESERVRRGDKVAPVEYILQVQGFKKKQTSFTILRVVVGDCNITFSTYPTEHSTALKCKDWESMWTGKNYVHETPWDHWNRLDTEKLSTSRTSDEGGGHSVIPVIDKDFQDDVFLLPHFRDEISTHLESQSLIHAGRNTVLPNGHAFALAQYNPWLDVTFDVTLKFLARIKRLNRLEFATISSVSPLVIL
jgi:hypothetical protein